MLSIGLPHQAILHSSNEDDSSGGENTLAGDEDIYFHATEDEIKLVARVSLVFAV